MRTKNIKNTSIDYVMSNVALKNKSFHYRSLYPNNKRAWNTSRDVYISSITLWQNTLPANSWVIWVQKTSSFDRAKRTLRSPQVYRRTKPCENWSNGFRELKSGLKQSLEYPLDHRKCFRKRPPISIMGPKLLIKSWNPFPPQSLVKPTPMVLET